MRRFAIVALLATCALIAGCDSKATKPDANYAAYLELYSKQDQAAQEQRTAFAQMAAKCTSDACITQVAAIAALSGGAGGANRPPPQPFVKQESMAAKFGLALVSQISPLAAAAVSWHAQDTSRDVSMAQFGFLGGVMHDVSGAVTSVAPTVTVGRDYIPGNVDNGTHVNGDLTNGAKTTIDNSGLYNTGDGNRINSPSDDHSATGDGCAGSTTCQSQPAPAAAGTP